MDFSQRLRELREEKGLSQEELANKLDLPRTSITHYESKDSERLPRKGRLYQIADFFDVSVDYLLGRTNEKKLDDTEEKFVKDTQQLTVNELRKKYEITVDGKPATDEELDGAIAFIRSLRQSK